MWNLTFNGYYMPKQQADHEFIEDWDRRREEILITVGSLKIEESSSEGQEQKNDRGVN